VVPGVDLVVPVKRLDRAKSRLRGTLPADRHTDLVLALLLDTVSAAAAAERVRRLFVVCEDDRVTAALAEAALPGVSWTDERGLPGLNAALRYGAEAMSGDVAVGALQADLPALRAADLDAALAEAAGRRAFCPDHAGTGTTLLLAAPGTPLAPAFGVGSAAAHAAGGAVPVGLDLPSLRCDVDTAADLARARRLGLGPHTTALLARTGADAMP
jgi:2-phospho-L-lactate/phosphoenolpyruvate guanylyltransferase